MSKIKPMQTNFTAGVLSPSLASRVDLQQYYNGASVIDNGVVLPQGGVTTRNGFQQISEIVNTSAGATVRVLPFIYSQTENYVLTLHMDGSFIINDPTGIEPVVLKPKLFARGSDIKDVRYTQSGDTMILVHPLYVPHRLYRDRLKQLEWKCEPINFKNIPVYDYGNAYVGSAWTTQNLTFIDCQLNDTFKLNVGTEAQTFTYNITHIAFDNSLTDGSVVGDDAETLADELTTAFKDIGYTFVPAYKTEPMVEYVESNGAYTAVNILYREFTHMTVRCPKENPAHLWISEKSSSDMQVISLPASANLINHVITRPGDVWLKQRMQILNSNAGDTFAFRLSMAGTDTISDVMTYVDVVHTSKAVNEKYGDDASALETAVNTALNSIGLKAVADYTIIKHKAPVYGYPGRVLTESIFNGFDISRIDGSGEVRNLMIHQPSNSQSSLYLRPTEVDTTVWYAKKVKFFNVSKEDKFQLQVGEAKPTEVITWPLEEYYEDSAVGLKAIQDFAKLLTEKVSINMIWEAETEILNPTAAQGIKLVSFKVTSKGSPSANTSTGLLPLYGDIVLVDPDNTAMAISDDIIDIDTGEVINPNAGKEPVWNDDRGYPVTVVLHGDRLVFGGSYSRPQSVWFSKIGQYFDFGYDFESPLATDALDITLSTKELNPITGLLSTRKLMVLTSGSIHLVDGENDIITPTTVFSKVVSYNGSKFIDPVNMDDRTFYLQSDTNSLNSTSYDFASDSYATSSSALLSGSLLPDPIQMAKVEGTSASSTAYLAVLNSDGSIGYYSSIYSQAISNWTRITTIGSIKDICSVDATLYAIVIRENKMFLEKMNEHTPYSDNSRIVTRTVPFDVIGGYEHLVGEKLAILADDYSLELPVLAGGIIKLPFKAKEVRLGLPIEFKVTTMPLNSTLASGNTLNSRKRVISATVNVLDSRDITLEYEGKGYPIADRHMGFKLKEAPQPLTGAFIKRFTGWTNKAKVSIMSKSATPITVLGLELKIQVKG